MENTILFGKNQFLAFSQQRDLLAGDFFKCG